MSELEDLLAAKAAANSAVAELEERLRQRLLAAKEAYRTDKSDESRVEFKEAVADLEAYRASVRGDLSIGGDAFVSPEQNEG